MENKIRDKKGRFVKGHKTIGSIDAMLAHNKKHGVWNKGKKCDYMIGNKLSVGREPWHKGTKGVVKPNSGSFKKGQSPWNKGKSGLQIPWNKGKKVLQTTGEKHKHWKGDRVGYTALHIWVRSKKGVTFTCEHCDKKHHRTHMANLDGGYSRDLTTWAELCPSCHKKYDILNQITPKNLFKKTNTAHYEKRI